MRVPYGWLAELLPGLPPVDRTVALLDGLGLGVEAVHELAGAPSGVVVVGVEMVRSIPGTRNLLEAVVVDGDEEYRVVCGAPNVHEGMRTALAKPGTELPAVGLAVGVRTIAGVESRGMLCSPRELGLYEAAGGIVEFGEDALIGAELAALWPAETVIELELTPNRADAFSILGVARDLAAKLGVVYRHPAGHLARQVPASGDDLRVEIRDSAACPRFTLQRIDDIRVGPSPLWLQRRLAAVGLRPRNNVVDVTNYVTFELGQPSHAYDVRALEGGTIIVRRARPGERLLALNDAELTFAAEDLLITTPEGEGSRPIGVAGVIGGLEDSVRPDTTAIALEAAHFDPVTVRKTAKRLGQVTDAHYRFERGVDPNLPPLASARAAQLIAELSGGTVFPGITDTGRDRPPEEVAYRPERVAFLMDMEVPAQRQKGYLEALGCRVEEVSTSDWRVSVPSWRFDLRYEEDLIEEVSRLHGYEHIKETVPTIPFVPSGGDVTYRQLRHHLAALGFVETITYAFTSDEELATAGAPPAAVRLLSPQGVERSVLRTALHPGLLRAAAANRSAESLAVFEIGHTFQEEERERLGLLLRGPWVRGTWLPPQALSFYLIKGLLESLAAFLKAEISFVAGDIAHLHPGVSAIVTWNGRTCGSAGQLHPRIAARLELPEIYLVELELPLEGRSLSFRDVVRQPHAERDLAVVGRVERSYRELAELVARHAGEHLESLEPFDVYQGSQVPEGWRSIALRLRFRHPQRSLTDDELDGVMGNIMAALREADYDIRA